MRRKADHKIEMLQNVKLFSACTEKELRRIAALADDIAVRPGTELTREGEMGREFFVVAEGQARVTKGGKKLATLGPGSFFGEMALLDQGPRAATVTADSDMRVYVLDARSFFTLINDVPLIARSMLRGVAERLREAEKKAVTH